MKFRHLLLIVLLVGGFWYFTSHPTPHLPLAGRLSHRHRAIRRSS
jgi:hypothetical protein